MASSNTALKVSDLDFFSIRNNLKDYLRSQDTFTDYDFEGSGLSVLLDVLAYNTYYNSFYLNMAANEAFLDTAQIRQNILSHAKVINYVPRSRQAATSKVTIRITPGITEDNQVSTITLDKYTQFLGSDKNGKAHSFVTINSNTATKVAGTFTFANVVLKQGEVITMQYPVAANNVLRRYEIPTANIDTSTLVVTVQESSSNTYTEVYKLADDLTEITASSRIYYLEENDTLNYTMYFGDDILGKKPKDGNIITATYIDTAGSEANNIIRFTNAGTIAGKFRNSVTVTTNQSSYGGVDKEEIEQIRFRAPHFYTAQNRAVTQNDYESLILRDYANIEAVSVWGGEENDPVVYGKVYMSLKTRGYYTLTNMEKEIIKNDLIENRNVFTIIPEIVDPNYCFILIRGKVTYNPSLTNKAAGELKTIVTKAIQDYANKELNTFKSTFKKSRLQYYIDVCDPSISGSDIKIYLQKQIPLDFNKSKKYTIDFNTPIQKGTIADKLYSFPEIVVFDRGVNRPVYIEDIPESFTGIDAILVTNSGYNYDSQPTVTITGDGSGATAQATVVNGKVESINIIDRGVNYTQASVAITGVGSEASATVRLEARYGKLRAYYFKSNGEKVIVNNNIGTVDYDKGKVTLTNFVPLSVISNSFYDRNTLTMNVLPNSDIIYPSRNRILTLDPNNAKSITIDMVAEN